MQDGALIEPLAVGLHAVRTARVSAGDKAVVLGSGAIGLCTAVMAARAGAAPLICTDVQPFNLERALTLGATHTIDARDPGACQQGGRYHGRGLRRCVHHGARSTR